MANDVVRNLGPGANGSFSYDSVGNAEDLYDILTNIDPVKTKFLSGFGTADPATSTNFQWFTERLRPPQDNAHLEKEDYKFAEIGSQEGLENFIQHFQNSGYVTDTQNRIKKAFRRGTSEFNAAVDHAIRGQGDDIEFMIVKSAVAQFENPGVTPARSGGIPYFMKQNELKATVENASGIVTLSEVSESKPVDLQTGDFIYFTAETMPTGWEANRAYYIRIETGAEKLKNKFKVYASLEDAVDGTSGKEIKPSDDGTNVVVIRRNVVTKGGSKFSLEDINLVLEMIYRRGGGGNQMYMSLRNKRNFSKMVNEKITANRPSDKPMSQYSDAATAYESDFGTVVARAHHLYSDNRIDILDMQYWDLKWLARTHEVTGLAKTGTYEKFVVESAVGVKATAPQASGAIVNIGEGA